MSNFDIKIGSVWKDWETLNVRPLRWDDVGMPPIRNQRTEFAMIPGSFHQGLKVLTQVVTFTCLFAGGISAVHAGTGNAAVTTASGLAAARQNFIDLFKPSNGKSQVREIRDRSGDRNLVAHVRYEAGLEHKAANRRGNSEFIYLPFVMVKGWHEETEQDETLSERQTSTYDYARKSPDGWTFFEHPNTNFVSDIFVHDDVLYTAEGQDGTGNVYIRKYNGSIWTQIGASEVVSSASGTIVFVSLNGTVYAATNTTSAVLYYFNGSAWVSLGVSDSGLPQDFEEIPGQGIFFATTHTVYKINGTTVTTLGTRDDGDVGENIYALAEFEGRLYAGGSMDGIGGATGQLVRYDFDAAEWQAVASVDSGKSISDLHGTSYLLVSGSFLEIGGISITANAHYNGHGFQAAANLAGSVQSSDTLADGRQIAVTFALPNVNTVWSDFGDIWQRETIAPNTNSTTVRAYSDGFILHNTDGEFITPGNTTVTYTGSADVHPYVTFYNSTSASIAVYQIENVTSGHRVWFQDLNVLAGETITVTFGPIVDNAARVSSDFRGSLTGKIRNGSQQESFALLAPDSPLAVNHERDNEILLYAHSSSLTSTMKWLVMHWSKDGGVNR